MSAGLILLAAMLSATHAPPKTPEAVTLSYGVGRDTCAHWLASPSQERDGVSWLLGYSTALNFINPNSHLVDAKTEGDGIVGDVRTVCRAQPSIPLQAAVGAVYGRMLRMGN